ncbi:peptidylprolyl isomerase [Aquabacterium sp.]|uniref:FKBP-type peptidyl-prolyl cis-trans isomerase n=1 Tax=Aquabacterium sp. TaxID=1872578 RepID=UPI0035B3D8C0
MLISKPCVVSLTWRLEDTQGQLIDELEAPVEFYFGGQDLFAKVEEALEGLTMGDDLQIHLEPEHAFGEYDADLVFFEAREIFPDGVEPGMQFDGPPEGSTTPDLPKDAIYTVTEVYEHHVVLDGNHPLAGIAIRLDIKVHGVRAATDDEIERGSVAESVVTVLHTAPAAKHLH